MILLVFDWLYYIYWQCTDVKYTVQLCVHRQQNLKYKLGVVNNKWPLAANNRKSKWKKTINNLHRYGPHTGMDHKENNHTSLFANTTALCSCKTVRPNRRGRNRRRALTYQSHTCIYYRSASWGGMMVVNCDCQHVVSRVSERCC